jgi:hypothetical protein
LSSTPKLESGEEDVSTDRKRQAVEGREDHHNKGTESEVKPNLTSYPRTVRIFEGHTLESAIMSDDRLMNEGTDDAALSLSSANPGFKVIPLYVTRSLNPLHSIKPLSANLVFLRTRELMISNLDTNTGLWTLTQFQGVPSKYLVMIRLRVTKGISKDSQPQNYPLGTSELLIISSVTGVVKR